MITTINKLEPKRFYGSASIIKIIKPKTIMSSVVKINVLDQTLKYIFVLVTGRNQARLSSDHS